MAFAGTFKAAIPGERKAFSIDFVNDLAAGDAIASVSTALTVFFGADASVASLKVSLPAVNGSVVSQGFGPGFQPGIIYRWTVTAKTEGGATLVSYAYLPCYALA
jgi:hypothetical protein